MSDDDREQDLPSGRNRPKQSFLSGSQQAILLGDLHKYSSDPEIITRVTTIPDKSEKNRQARSDNDTFEDEVWGSNFN